MSISVGISLPQQRQDQKKKVGGTKWENKFNLLRKMLIIPRARQNGSGLKLQPFRKPILYLKARPALVQRDQGLAQHLAGGGGGNAGGVQRGGQLVQVCADDVGLGHSADSIQQLQKAYAASLRGTGAREAGGVKAVQIDGQVHRHLALAQLCGQFGKAGKIELVHLGVLGSKLKLCPVAAADAELMDAAVPYQLVAAAQHTSVAELRAQIVVPQVGVGVEVHDMQIRVFLHRSPHGTQCDQMLIRISGTGSIKRLCDHG